MLILEKKKCFFQPSWKLEMNLFSCLYITNATILLLLKSGNNV